MRHIEALDVGQDRIDIWREDTDVTTLADASRQTIPGRFEIRINGRPATIDEIDRLSQSDLQGSDQFRAALQRLRQS